MRKDGKFAVPVRVSGGDLREISNVHQCFDLREELISRARSDVNDSAGREVGILPILLFQKVRKGLDLDIGCQDPDISKVLDRIGPDLDVISSTAAIHQTAAEGIVHEIERPFRVRFQQDPRGLQIVGGLREELRTVFRQRDLRSRHPRHLHDAGRGIDAAARTALEIRQEIPVRLRKKTDLVCRQPGIRPKSDLGIDREVILRLNDSDRQHTVPHSRRVRFGIRVRFGRKKDLVHSLCVRQICRSPRRVRQDLQIVLSEDPCIVCAGEVNFRRIGTSHQFPAAGDGRSGEGILERLRIEDDAVSADLHAVPQQDLRRHVVLHDRARHTDADSGPGIHAERVNFCVRFGLRPDTHAVFRLRNRFPLFQFWTIGERGDLQKSGLDLRIISQRDFRGRAVFQIRFISDAGDRIHGHSPRGKIMAGVSGCIEQNAPPIRLEPDRPISLNNGSEGIIDERHDPGRRDPGRLNVSVHDGAAVDRIRMNGNVGGRCGIPGRDLLHDGLRFRRVCRIRRTSRLSAENDPRTGTGIHDADACRCIDQPRLTDADRDGCRIRFPAASLQNVECFDRDLRPGPQISIDAHERIASQRHDVHRAADLDSASLNDDGREIQLMDLPGRKSQLAVRLNDRSFPKEHTSQNVRDFRSLHIGSLRVRLRQNSEFRRGILRFRFVKVRETHVQIDLSLREIHGIPRSVGPIQKEGEIVSCVLQHFGIIDRILRV